MTPNLVETIEDLCISDPYIENTILPRVKSLVEIYKPTDESQLEFSFIEP